MEDRDVRTFMSSDYMLGVFDAHRMGAIRFRLSDNTPFLDDLTGMVVPQWARLRDLEYASLQIRTGEC